MNEKLKEEAERLAKAMNCSQDCENCDKTVKECILDIRICLNVLLKAQYKKIKKQKHKSKENNSMVI